MVTIMIGGLLGQRGEVEKPMEAGEGLYQTLFRTFIPSIYSSPFCALSRLRVSLQAPLSALPCDTSSSFLRL